jgi:hypothetical protein
VPGVEAVLTEEGPSGVPGWAAVTAWMALGVAAAAAVAVRRRRPASALLHGSLQGLPVGSIRGAAIQLMRQRSRRTTRT